MAMEGLGLRRDSALLTQLERAQQKISTLEEFIRDREKQLHSTVSRLRLEGRDSRGYRLRRVGRSHDILLRMRSASRDEPEEADIGESIGIYCSVSAVL